MYSDDCVIQLGNLALLIKLRVCLHIVVLNEFWCTALMHIVEKANPEIIP